MVAHPLSAVLATLTIATAAALTHAPAQAADDRAGLVAMLDVDADGRLSQVEVRLTPLASRFAMLDANGDGTLDRRELRAIGVRMPPRSLQETPRLQARLQQSISTPVQTILRKTDHADTPALTYGDQFSPVARSETSHSRLITLLS